MTLRHGFTRAALLVLALPTLLSAQSAETVRRLTAAETGCDSLAPPSTDSTYEVESVDRPVKAPYIPVTALPYRMREVLTGRTTLRFVVEPSGYVDRCSIALVEESAPGWTEAVLPALRRARYEAAQKGGHKVRQLVHQTFTYHSDGRTGVSQ